MQPIVVNRPEIFQKIRSRLGVQTGRGRNAELDMVIHPIIDVDPLLLEGRGHDFTASVIGNASVLLFACPDGEFWHLLRMSALQIDGTFDYQIGLAAPKTESPATTVEVPLAPVVADGSAMQLIDLGGITMRPGMSLRATGSTHSVTGDLFVMLLYDLEDCSS